MLNVCFIVDQLSNGGSERVVSIISNRLSTIGYNVTIVMLHGNRRDYHVSKNITVKTIKYSKNNKIKSYFQRIFKLRKIFKDYNFDVIISFDVYNNIFTLLSSLFLNNKVVICERNDPNRYPQSPKMRSLRNIIYKLGRNFIFQTYDQRDYFNNLKMTNSCIISNPITSNLPVWDLKGTKKKIVSVGRLTEQKNILLQIEAMKDLKSKYEDLTLEIYGEGPLRETLENKILKDGLSNHVFLKGFSENVHKQILSARVYIITSDYEGISNSMIEALGIGIPVVSTDSPIGGARLFIENGYNGFLIKMNDQKSLINIISKLLDDDDLSREVSENAKRINNQISEDKIILEWENFLGVVMEDKNG